MSQIVFAVILGGLAATVTSWLGAARRDGRRPNEVARLAAGLLGVLWATAWLGAMSTAAWSLGLPLGVRASPATVVALAGIALLGSTVGDPLGARARRRRVVGGLMVSAAVALVANSGYALLLVAGLAGCLASYARADARPG